MPRRPTICSNFFSTTIEKFDLINEHETPNYLSLYEVKIFKSKI